MEMSELRKIEVKHEKIPGNYNSEILKKIKILNGVRDLFYKYGVIGLDCDHKEHYGNLSARTKSNEFVITATQTSGLEKIDIDNYPVVSKFKEDILFSNGISDNKPSVEATTHLGFYIGNNKIKYVGHGHYPPIYNRYKNLNLEAIVWDEKIKYGSKEIMEKAIEAGSDGRILNNECLYGNWGLIIPKGHFNAFFLVGENAKALSLGFLKIIDNCSFKLHNDVINDLYSLNLKTLEEEDFVSFGKVYS